MKIRDALRRGTEKLRQSACDIALAHLEAQLILGFVLEKSKEYLIAYGENRLDTAACESYFQRIDQRAADKPMAYILGYKEFMGLDFIVDETVLIPRDDTEILVRKVLDCAGAIKSPVEVLNIGTGSGCIEVALAKNCHDMNITGVDISEKALATAVKNLRLHGVEDRVQLLVSDIFSGISPARTFDVICSNPPYISKDELKRLSADIVHYEPHSALYGGEDGLDFYRRILSQAQHYLKSDGVLFLEMGSEQSAAIAQLLKEHHWVSVQIFPDLQGHSRIMTAKKGTRGTVL